ncbi:sulfate ABC transporter permease subunit CysT [Gracilibacillus alcaliphilus]|uniref:sulfate ABC transporter permease subunit CysT n=1 Tax=Gracilibacillus alcaliphilus TaxID=1401441 RepID=UPI00195D3D17|nr:sulfate ABC transporter permease subunit CysT [Gracilibacillus alcaliphilus]MBM7677897.1 sulfate transport system permease protein [Gracilibacillus alcaliphilus]
MRDKLEKYALRSILIGYLIVLIVAPLSAVYVQGFSLGLSNFWKTVTDEMALHAITLTIRLAVIATLIQIIIGTLIAYVLTRYEFPGKRYLNSLVDLPFALPTAVSGVMFLMVLTPNSFVGQMLDSIGISLLFNQSAIIIGMVFVTFPFIVRAVQPLLENLDEDQVQASYTLGASKWRTFCKVVFPAILPGIIAGSLLAFSRALAEFGVIALISGNIPMETLVASVYIFGQIESFNTEGATAVSVVLLTFSFLVLWITNLTRRRGDI